jgi:hypothetical protein
MAQLGPPDQFEQQGWQEQLRRVERWHERATRALDPYNRVPEAETIDTLYAFFQAAYHMRDWLRNSGAASQAQLKSLMDNESLELCRALCNGSKHFVLNPKQHPKTNHIGLLREYVPPPRPGDRDGMSNSRPSLLAFVDRQGNINYRRIDELMAECLAAWQTFCAGLS